MALIKWLLVGAGDIANSRVADALCSADCSQLLAVCDVVPERAQALAAKTGAPKVFFDYQQALSESAADAVYIATPHRFHVAQCHQALQANKHFLCEKPLGINGSECLALLPAVRASDCISCCSNYRLYSQQFITTQRIIAAGEIGKLTGGWAHDEENYYNPDGKPSWKSEGASPVHGYGFYLINLSQILFGMPESVFARMSSFNPLKRQDYDIDDLENIILCFPGGQQFSIIINNSSLAKLRHSYQFYGTHGRIYWPECPPHFNSTIYKVTSAGSTEITDSFSGTAPGQRPNWHLPLVNAFIQAIQTRTQPLCSIESAVKTAVITDAINRSAASGKLETIEWEN